MPNKKSKRNGRAASKSGSVADKSADLWFACRDKNVVKARAAIAAGADVNYVHSSISCLTVAAFGGCNQIVVLLLATGADKDAQHHGNVQRMTPLMSAATNGHDKTIELLSTAGAEKEAKNLTGGTALTMATEEGHVKCIELLLTAGADKEAKDLKGYTALITASEKGHEKCVEVLLRAGADKDAKNVQGTALMAAAAPGHDKCIKLLLTAGADKDTKATGEEFTALMFAAQNGHGKCVELLLTAGANKESKNEKGSTALMHAAREGHDKCVKRLLSAGCDMNALANDGASALIAAIVHTRIDCVRTLVRAGADISIQFQGQSLDSFDVCNTDAMKAALRLPTSAVAARCEVCALCATALSTTKRLRFGRCLAVCYCSQACQRSDWKGDHKQTCKAPSAVAAAPVKNDTSEQTCEAPVAKKQYRCVQCSKTTTDRKKMQACSVCITTVYCNRACQVAHWQLHKPVCKARPVE
jgi:ankyrin repeat protein